MAYTKINWHDLPNTTTPQSAENFNHMDTGIYNNSLVADSVGDISNLETTDKTSVINAINELKDGEEYSTNEVKTNKIWIDEKPIYRKVIDTGTLPNNTEKNVNHNISNLDVVINCYGMAYNSNTNQWINLPFITAGSTNNVRLFIKSTTISLTALYDASGYSQSFVVIEYTKTSD